MAGGYIIDPQTGQPAVQTASGMLLPLGLSQGDLSAAGMPGPPGVPAAPDMGPDMRVAGPGGGPMAQWGNEIPTLPAPTPQEQQAQQASALRERMGAAGIGAPASNEHDSAPQQPDWMPTGRGSGAPAPSGVDPSTLVRPGQSGGAAAPQQGAPDDEAEIREKLMREALTPRGGGGPRSLGVTSETQKYTTFQNPGGDPEKAAAAQEALSASDKYNEELAKSLTERHEQAYQAQQQEYAARSGQLAAAQQRFEAQQNMLQDYQAKRDAMVQEAAQLKTPQMEDYWQSRGTFANVMTGLSIALGGALQGLHGGENPGLQMANQSIDRWIASQKEAYNRAEGRINDSDNQFAKMVQMFGSENLATEHMREQAWTVRDGMLRDYAQKIGTPSALEAYNAAMLQTEAERAALQARASQGAQVEIEQKLSMQGGGGGGQKTFRQALAETAGGLKDYREITGGGQKDPGRAIDSEKTNSLAAALETVQAADEIKGHVTALGYGDSDTDDPRSGPVDAITKNIPGTETRKRGQDLDQATFSLARGAQQFLGKSDNDASLAEKQARGLGGSGRERIQAAERLKQKAISKAKIELSAMTPDQRAAFKQALAPDQRAMIDSITGTDTRPAASAQEVR